MQAINTPTITKTEANNRTTWTVGNYNIHLIPTVAGWQVIVTRDGLFGKTIETQDGEFHDTKEDGLESVQEWVENAVENETEWEDE